MPRDVRGFVLLCSEDQEIRGSIADGNYVERLPQSLAAGEKTRKRRNRL
jgi:hypothetical protein